MKNRILGVLLLMALSVSLIGCKKQTEEVQEVVYELTAYSKEELVDNTY